MAKAKVWVNMPEKLHKKLRLTWLQQAMIAKISEAILVTCFTTMGKRELERLEARYKAAQEMTFEDGVDITDFIRYIWEKIEKEKKDSA